MDVFNIAPPSTEIVSVDGGEVAVRGLSNRVVFRILGEHPEVLAAFSGGSIELARAFVVAPDACLKLMAEGAGVVGDADKMALLDALPMESQFDVLAAIVRRTCPGGVGPFVSRLLALWTTEPAATKEQDGGAGELIPEPRSDD